MNSALASDANVVKKIQSLLNGISASLKNTVPIEIAFEPPKLQQAEIIERGIMIGTIGDVKGHLVLSGDEEAFNAIAKRMYGMELEGDMLVSFSCELTNMVGGSLVTLMESSDIQMDITTPSVLNGDQLFPSAANAIQLGCSLEDGYTMNIYYLLE